MSHDQLYPYSWMTVPLTIFTPSLFQVSVNLSGKTNIVTSFLHLVYTFIHIPMTSHYPGQEVFGGLIVLQALNTGKEVE